MDYNDGFNPSRLNQEEITEFKQSRSNDGEDTENCLEKRFWRPLNGVRQQDMYNGQEHQIAQYSEHDIKDTFYNKNASSVHFEKMHTVPLENFNDILSTNKQNMEVSQTKNALTGNPYESLKFGRMQNLPMLPEDMRISKIIRRLLIETNRNAAVDLCKKLETAVRNQSNATYICRSFDILFDNMLTVLLQCPIECLENASIILGIMGYINRYDFAIYKMHLTKAYENHKSIRKYLMISLKTTLKCDAVNLDLKTYSERLLELLKEYLENAEVTENFISISETIAEFSKNYKASFQKHFTDIVDIIIGWHLEVEQPAELKRHCSKILQRLAEYFLNELDFTFGLLGQFVEDIEACRDDILSEENPLLAKQQSEIRVGAFIGAFLSIAKALTYKGVNLNEFGNAASILRNAKGVVNNIATICFDILPLVSEETVVNLNEFYTTILFYDKNVENLNLFENIIQLQLKHLATFNDSQQASFLFMALNLVSQYRTQLPISFVTHLLATDNQVLQELKLCCGKKTHKLLMKIYHEILVIKNVPLLQEAYRHILADINKTVATLQTKEEASPDTMMRCEMLFNFYLASLTALACQTSSIIGMYALKPSILELLITNCKGSSYNLWHKYPTLHRALMELIVDHCKKNHNFRQSSRLLQQHQDSPSSENFAMILKFLSELLKWHISDLVFKWLENILQECLEDFEILTKNEEFLNICGNIVLCAMKQPRECASVLQSLLKYPKLPEQTLSNVRDLSLCVIESSDQNLAATYCIILSRLPLDVSLTPNCEKQFHANHKQKLLTLYQWHKSSAWYNGLRPKYFKTFLESLDPATNANGNLYSSLIEKSSCNIQRDRFIEYLKILQENQQLLSCHLQNEAARYCVQQKLRTTLGKPQETFLGIEAIIMKYARFLAEKEGLPVSHKNLQNVMQVQENCRMLLGFLECLEKHIYNASEGTAYAMLPAEKPSKTFFRVNAPTCREWFKRIRTAVNLISLHCMEPAMVIRYSEIILQIEANHSNMALLDRTVTSLVWALYNCGESDTLHGLHIWLKTKHGKRFEWIQHVAEQASGHLEKASAGYLNVLHDENNKSMDSFSKEFIQRQLTDCFYHTARWSEIPAVSQEIIYSKQHLQIMETVFQTSGYQKFNWQNQELNVALVELTEWPEDNSCNDKNKLTPKLDTFSYYEVLRKLQDSCITKINSAYLNNGVFESIQNSVQQGIREGLLHGYEPGSSNNHLDELFIINHVAQKLLNKEEIQIAYNNTNADIELSSFALSKCLHWSMLSSGQQNVTQQCNLLLNLVSRARLENNLNYCQTLLDKFFKIKHLNLDSHEIVEKLKMNQFAVDINDKVLVQGLEETVKCIYAQTNSVSEALELASACCSEILQTQKKLLTTENFVYPESISNLLLYMADWLNVQRLNNANLSSGQQFQKLQDLLPEITCCTHFDNSKPNSLPSSEYYVGKLLNASIMCKYNSGEAWFSYGNWCYRWGKKLMEAKTAEQSSAASINDTKDTKLTKHNIFSIQEALKDRFDIDAVEKIVEVLNKNIISVISDDNAEELDANINSENTTEILKQELQKVCELDDDQLSEIFAIWRQAQKGVYSYYEEATRAYFKYLAIESEEVSKRSDIANSDNNEVEDCTFVTTTLRLLRLIVKHAIGLQDVLEDGLRNTPLRPWKVIVPQLFSRLNHHEPYVKKSLLELLCRLAVNQPQLIIFPAVVGAQQELKHRNNADSQTLLTNCFGILLNSLSEQQPETVLQVQLLVKELRRITLLWDEYWVHNLSQLYAEYSSLYNSLDAEAKKCNNAELMQDKYEIFRQHLLADFKQIAAFTEKEAETNYERSFQERFGDYIDAVLKELQKPSDEANPSEYWHKIKQLHNIFQQRPLRGNSSVLRISEISPVLANMQNTTIAMPGVDTYAQPAIYIKSVDTTALIFTSTKTKPKKLSFFGSNGQRYTYLFKGQEDLHLDERIMQFLAISNSMMARSYGSKSKIDCFKANHYSVIPLGSRSGLIRWVDNCSPLFAIYKKWQQRDALLKQQQKERQSSKVQEHIEQSPVVNNATRPSELFYNKLTPLLAECNLKVSDPRRQWPMSVLKRVLKELSAETPKDLVSKEIWCYSANTVDWRKSVRRYSLSLAVMSIIGYVIGLGDRHLDNVLIKLSTGEILHIDYSVCFEKGKTLRVPEKVPFRMTQNLKDALGLVGTEGAFRIACTHVLKILRKERETLLTLLEAFVYDPLVDWTVSDDGTTTVSRRTSAHTAANLIASLNIKRAQNASPKNLNKNKKLEIDLSRQTLALRITEIKPTAIKYKNDLDAQLGELNQHIQNILDARKTALQLDKERDNFSKQLSMVRELEALGSAQTSHAFIQRYNVYKNELDNFNKIKLMVQKTLNELELLVSTYFNLITNPEVMQQNSEFNTIENDGVELNKTEFDVIKDLAIDNNWNNAYVQAKFTRHEMENAFIQCKRSVLECRDLLMFYSGVMQFYPRSHLKNYRLIKYKNIFSNLMGVVHKSDDDIEVDSKQNIECCSKYFESMNAIFRDLQENAVQAKTNLEEHKQQLMITSSTALNSINDFISLNPSNNTQILIMCMLRHVLEASQVFQQHDQTLLQNRDYFWPIKQLNFLHLVRKFVDSIYETCGKTLPKDEVFSFLLATLECICNTRDTLESLANKLFSVLLTDYSVELKEMLTSFEKELNFTALEKHTVLKGILYNIDLEMEKLETSLKMLQEKILRAQNVEENSIIEMAFCNINISNMMRKLGTDLKVTLVSTLRQAADSLRTHDIDNIFDAKKIRIAIDDLLFDLQSKLFGGLLMFAVQNLNKTISSSLATPDVINEFDLSNSDILCGSLYVALQHEFLIVYDEFVVTHYSQMIKDYQLIATAYYWLNEAQHPHSFITKKQDFLTRLHEIYQVLVVWKSTMIKIQADLELHRNSFKDLIQVLNATESMIVRQKQFEDNIECINQRYKLYLNLSVMLSEYAAVLLQFEMCPEQQPFENLIKLYDDAQQQCQQSESSITAVERNLVQLLDPEDKIDQCWIENVSGLLDEMIFGVQKKISDLEKADQALQNTLLADAKQLQTILDSSLRGDLRQLLRILSKICKQTTKSDCEDFCTDLKNLQQSLKVLQTKLSELQAQLLSKEFDTPSLIEVQEKITQLCNLCQKNNDELNLLLIRFLQFDAERDQQTGELKTSSQNDLANKEVIDCQIGEQKRNAYAVSVWKRIRMKLEGRDPDHNRRSTAAEQVDYAIREATNEENLASLYEGWTPWV